MGADMLESMFIASLMTLIGDEGDDEPGARETEPATVFDVSQEREELRKAAISDDDDAFSEALDRLVVRMGRRPAMRDDGTLTRRRVRQLDAVKRFEAWAQQESRGRTEASRSEARQLNRVLHTWFSQVTVTMDEVRVEIVASHQPSSGEPPSTRVTRAILDRADWTRVACHTDRPRLRHQAWDDMEILAALRAWAEAHGRSPTSIDCVKGDANIPTSRTVLRHFGTWNRALRRAGLKPHVPAAPRRNRPWRDDEVILAPKAWANEHGRAPRWHEWRRAGEGQPCHQTVADHFGGWPAGLAAAGLKPLTPA